MTVGERLQPGKAHRAGTPVKAAAEAGPAASDPRVRSEPGELPPPDAPRAGHGEVRVDGADMRRILGLLALASAGFEGALRQLEPGLTLSQYAALEAINRAEGMRPFRLANQMQISRQLAWQTCKRLESLGLVEMTGIEAGKRGVEVVPSAAGAAHLDRIAALTDRLAARLALPGPKGERFDAQPTRRGLRLLAQAAAALQAEADAGPDAGPDAGRELGTGPADGSPATQPRATLRRPAGKGAAPDPDAPTPEGGAQT